MNKKLLITAVLLSILSPVYLFSQVTDSVIANIILKDNATQKSIDSLQKVYEDAKEKRDKYAEAKALLNIGHGWKKLQVYDKANDYLTKALEIFEILRDNKKIAGTLLTLGDLFRSIGEFDLSVDYSKRALALYEKESDKEGIAMTCDRIASAYYETSPYRDKHIDSTFTYVSKALLIARAINDNEISCSSMNVLGSAYNVLKKYDLAIAHLKDALQFATEKNIVNDIPLIQINIAFSYYYKKDYEKAIEYALPAYNSIEKENILAYIDMSTLCLFRSYKELGDYKNAFKFLELFNSNRWRLFDINRLSQIRAMQIKYDSERKEIDLNNQKQRTFLWTLIFLVLLAAAALLIVFYVYRHRLMKKKNFELEMKNALISEQNEKLTELNATKDKFFSIIGHDLKNPYQSLLGFSNILIQDYHELSEREIKEFAGYIFEASDMGNRLLQNLLDWSRSETGRIKYEPELFSLNSIINDSILLASNTAKQKDVVIRTRIPEELKVFCDKNMIYTVIRNLLSNAIKFSYRGGVVTIHSAQTDSKVEIRVADNGVGMSEVLMEDLFKIDKRITKDGTENEKGTGLGLFLCKEFVEKNNGRIWVESEPGKGSIFVFTLPARNIEKSN